MKWKLYDDEFSEWGKVVTAPRLDAHTEKEASEDDLGHVKIDGATIKKNSEGKISVSDSLVQEIKDYTDSAIDNLPDFGTVVSYDVGNSPGNVPMVQNDGKIDASIIPSIAITDVYVVGSEDELTTLNVDVGDVGIVVEEGIRTSYILRQTPSSDISNWEVLSDDLVLSVNGKIGNVTLNKDDVGLGNVTNESKETMFTSPVFTGTPEVPTPAMDDRTGQIANTQFVQAIVEEGTKFNTIKDEDGKTLQEFVDEVDERFSNSDERFITYYFADEVTLGLQRPIFPIPFECRIKTVTVSISEPSSSSLGINLQKKNSDNTWTNLLDNAIPIGANVDYHEYTVFGDILLGKGDRLGVEVSNTINDAKNMTVMVAIERLY